MVAEQTPQTPSGPVRRYAVRQLSGVLHWGIFDRHMGAWCSLPYGTSLLPLEWKTAEEAEAWLYACRVVWGGDLAPAPANP